MKDFFYLPYKVLYALAELPRSLFRPRQPRLLMTLLVKNEEELLERNLRFHHSMGVDGFIVTDNNSTDRTPQILEEYRQKGWVIEIIRETATGYEQKRWVDRMVWKAKRKYKADWVINADADEFWYTPSGNLKHDLAQTKGNIVRCPMRNVIPDEHLPLAEWHEVALPVADKNLYDLSLYSIFDAQIYKVAHRTAGYVEINMGNHKAFLIPRRVVEGDITVFHYGTRLFSQFLAKIENGGRELEKHQGRHGGRHWRYFYRLCKEGKLPQEYRRVVGLSDADSLRRDGFIQEDARLVEYFKEKGI